MVEDWALYLVPVPAQVLYVSRLGLPQVGGGAYAGEAYLVDRLSRLRCRCWTLPLVASASRWWPMPGPGG